MNILATYCDLPNGVHGFVLFHLLIAAFSLAGLWHGDRDTRGQSAHHGTEFAVMAAEAFQA